MPNEEAAALSRVTLRGGLAACKHYTRPVQLMQRLAISTVLRSGNAPGRTGGPTSSAEPCQRGLLGGQTRLGRIGRFTLDSLVFGNDLRSEEKQNGADLDREQCQDRRCHRAID